jgi:hypothetical protein
MMETVLHFQPVLDLSDDEFFAFCQINSVLPGFELEEIW